MEHEEQVKKMQADQTDQLKKSFEEQQSLERDLMLRRNAEVKKMFFFS